MKHLIARELVAAAMVLTLCQLAYSQQTVVVPGTAQIFLAEQPDGTRFGADIVPTNSPIAVDTVAFDPAARLQFVVSGATAQHPSFPLRDADGTGEYHLLGPYANLDVSGIYGPLMSLVAVFFDLDQIESPPSHLNFDPAHQSFASLAPKIQQLFFIGDGRRGRGAGDYQKFAIPAGADALYLGLFDAPNNNNIGQLNVTIVAVPEPNTIVLSLIGSLTALAFSVTQRWRRRR